MPEENKPKDDEEKKGGGLPSGGLPDQMPDLPSFRPGADAASGAGGLFGRSSAGKAALKLRGLASSSSIVDRLKQLRKKDLVFIASGLSVLMLAPLAEHFVLGPSEDSNVLKQGFDTKNGTPFTEANPYETGTGMATGNLPGQSSDIITPLNVRDPMSLIFGAGAQQPAVTPPGAGTGSGSGAAKDGWKDAIGEASRAGARGAAESAGLPAPRGNLAGSLRGLSALSGSSYGGGPSFNLGPVNAAVGKGVGSNMVAGSAAPGYKGPAARSNTSASSIDALKAAADRAGNMFNGRGSAADNLQSAAREAIPTGGSGSGEGGPGKGDAGKNGGGNTSKDAKTMGESLAFLRAKLEMEKAIDLKWKKIEWDTFGKSKMIQEEMIKLGFDFLKVGIETPLAKALAKGINGALGITKECYSCGNLGNICVEDVCGGKGSEAAPGDSAQCTLLYQGIANGSCKKVGAAGPAGAAPGNQTQAPGTGPNMAERMSPAEAAQQSRVRAAATRQTGVTQNSQLAALGNRCGTDTTCTSCHNTLMNLNQTSRGPIETNVSGVSQALVQVKTGLIEVSEKDKTLVADMKGSVNQLSTVIAQGKEALKYLPPSPGAPAAITSASPAAACQSAQAKIAAAKQAYDRAETLRAKCNSVPQEVTNKIDGSGNAGVQPSHNLSRDFLTANQAEVNRGDGYNTTLGGADCQNTSYEFHSAITPVQTAFTTAKGDNDRALTRHRDVYGPEIPRARQWNQDVKDACDDLLNAMQANPKSAATFVCTPLDLVTAYSTLNGYVTGAETDVTPRKTRIEGDLTTKAADRVTTSQRLPQAPLNTLAP